MIENLVLIDWISIALLSAFGITGFFNGFMKEVFSAAAWIVSLFIAWFYGPLLFPILEVYIETLEIKKALSFLILFLSFFLLLKFIGSTFSKITSVIGLKGVDRILGLCFGTLKVTAVLTSLYIYNLDFLDTKQWWLDSLTREYTIQFAESIEPILKDWKLGTSTFLNKDNLKLNL
jgi:membrane protein required for colicin V production